MLTKNFASPFRARLALLAGLAIVAVARATTVIFPVEAIDDLWQLQADDFKAKYAGINITGLGPSDEGWYVRYRHENLTYMFGPLADNEAARKKKWDLETVRDAAIRNRASLSTSKVDYVKFTYSGVYGKGGGNTPYGGKKGDGSGAGAGDDKDGNGAGGKDGSGKDGSGKDGSGDGAGDKLAGGDGTGDQNGGDGTGNQAGGGKDGKGGKNGKGGKDGKGGGDSADGSGDDDGSVVGAGKGGALQKVASAKGGGGKSGSGGGSGGQGGQQGQQSGQQGGQQGGQSGQSGGGQQGGGGGAAGGQQGQPGGQPSGGSSGGGGNPLQLVGMLLKLILGI